MYAGQLESFIGTGVRKIPEGDIYDNIWQSCVAQSNDIGVIPAALSAVILRCLSCLRRLWSNFPDVRFWPIVRAQHDTRK